MSSNPYEIASHLLMSEQQSLWNSFPYIDEEQSLWSSFWCADKGGAILLKQLPICWWVRSNPSETVSHVMIRSNPDETASQMLMRSNPYETAYHVHMSQEQSLWSSLPCADKWGVILMKELPTCWLVRSYPSETAFPCADKEQSLWNSFPFADEWGAILTEQLPMCW